MEENDDPLASAAPEGLPSSSSNALNSTSELARETLPSLSASAAQNRYGEGERGISQVPSRNNNASSFSDNKDALSALTLLSFASAKAQGREPQDSSADLLARQQNDYGGGNPGNGGHHSPLVPENIVFTAAASSVQQQQLQFQRLLLFQQQQQALMAGSSTLPNGKDVNTGFQVDPSTGILVPSGLNYHQYPPSQNGNVVYPGGVVHHQHDQHVSGHSQQPQRQGEDEVTHTQQQTGTFWMPQLPYVGSWVSQMPAADHSIPPILHGRQVTPSPVSAPPVVVSSKTLAEGIENPSELATGTESGEISIDSQKARQFSHATSRNNAEGGVLNTLSDGTSPVPANESISHNELQQNNGAELHSRQVAPVPSPQMQQPHQQPTMPTVGGPYASSNMLLAEASPPTSDHQRNEWLLALAQAPSAYGASPTPQFADGTLPHPQLAVPIGLHQQTGVTFDQAQHNYFMLAQQQHPQQQQLAFLNAQHANQAAVAAANYGASGRLNGFQTTSPVQGGYFTPGHSVPLQLDNSAGRASQLSHGSGTINGPSMKVPPNGSSNNYSSQQKSGRCRLEGCDEPACGSRAGFCAAHAYGPRRCQYPGCTKCAQGGSRKFCISHGGGRRCQHPGCSKGARDRFFCAAHGGGKRCVEPDCKKGAVGGTDRCTAHGGGRRCKSLGCPRSAQSGTNFCVCHGGGRTCKVDRCSRVARGRSQFCASHRSAQMCPHSGCEKYTMNYNSFCDDHQRSRSVPLTMLPGSHMMSTQQPKQVAPMMPLADATAVGIRGDAEAAQQQQQQQPQQPNQFAWNNLQFQNQAEHQLQQRDVSSSSSNFVGSTASLPFAEKTQPDGADTAAGLVASAEFPFAPANGSNPAFSAPSQTSSFGGR